MEQFGKTMGGAADIRIREDVLAGIQHHEIDGLVQIVTHGVRLQHGGQANGALARAKMDVAAWVTPVTLVLRTSLL